MTTRSESIRGSGQVLDGFITRTKAPSQVKQSSAQVIHRKIDRSQALMRSLVRRPKASQSTAATISGVDVKGHSAGSPANHQAHHLRPKLDRIKLARAGHVSQHKLVQRFGRAPNDPPAKLKPAAAKALRSTVRPLATASAKLHNSALAKPLPSMITSASHYQLERLLDWALVHADAHKQSLEEATGGHRRVWRRLRRWPRTLTIIMPLIILLTAAICITYLKVPSLAIKFADWRSGVAASVPAYSPSGFKLAGAPTYQPGQVNLTYQAGSGQGYQISQRTSNWDSASLLANYLKPANLPYQVTESASKTIYTYGRTNATWVEGGIWYVIHNDAQLNADQVTRIATSF